MLKQYDWRRRNIFNLSLIKYYKIHNSSIMATNTKTFNFSIITPLFFTVIFFFIIQTFDINNCNTCLEFVFAQTFTEPIDLTPGNNYGDSHIDSSGENVFISMTNNTSGPNVLFTKSIDGGISFDNLKQVNSDVEPSVF